MPHQPPDPPPATDPPLCGDRLTLTNAPRGGGTYECDRPAGHLGGHCDSERATDWPDITQRSYQPAGYVPPPPPANPLADELRGILDDLHDAEHGDVPKPLVRERLERLAQHVERLGATAETTITGELDVTAAGLDPAQEIRARAAELAVAWLHPHWTGSPGERGSVLDAAAEFAAWIRDGSRP